jgi:hypothetical protein
MVLAPFISRNGTNLGKIPVMGFLLPVLNHGRDAHRFYLLLAMLDINFNGSTALKASCAPHLHHT